MKNQEDSANAVQDNKDFGLAMKKNEELQNEFHFAVCRKPFMNIHETGIYGKLGKYMKIFSYMILLAVIGLVFNSCMGGYVTSEPQYTEYARPQRPSETHIWIEGDWGWNNQSHVYVQKAGYWDRPRQNQTYVSGHWQTTQRGKSWSKGHWQKQHQQRGNYNNR